MTDYASHRFGELKPEYVDKYFVANEEMKANLTFNGINSEKIFVTGIPVAPAFLNQMSCLFPPQNLHWICISGSGGSALTGIACVQAHHRISLWNTRQPGIF